MNFQSPACQYPATQCMCALPNSQKPATQHSATQCPFGGAWGMGGAWGVGGGTYFWWCHPRRNCWRVIAYCFNRMCRDGALRVASPRRPDSSHPIGRGSNFPVANKMRKVTWGAAERGNEAVPSIQHSQEPVPSNAARRGHHQPENASPRVPATNTQSPLANWVGLGRVGQGCVGLGRVGLGRVG